LHLTSKDLNGIITSWNAEARRLFGYEEGEIVGQSILRLIPMHLRHEEDKILRKIRAGEKIEHYETTRVSKSGEIREVAVTISPIRNTAGEVIGVSKIARDVSDRKKVERMAIEAEKIATTGRMAAAIAHEINNPLASVLNLIFLVRQGGLSPEDTQNCLATAESELERVSHIARQTLGFYRDTGSPSEVHLRDLMGNVLAVFKSRALTHGIVVDEQYTDLRKISVHPGEIVQVFSNVVSNAIDAMPHGGKLSISLVPMKKTDRDGVQISVSDTGYGIRRDDLARVFDPFFTTKGNLGTGIGLWIARQLTERHGGQISISSSTGPNDSGTNVATYLPFNVAEGKITKVNGSESKEETR
jgi:PAS domain S-box-containing protein